MTDYDIHLNSHQFCNISEQFIAGERFIKWDEDNSSGVLVTAYLDSSGFFLWWQDQHGIVDCLLVSQIRDTRNGRHAKTSKDSKIRDLCTAMGSFDIPIEDRTVSICYGSDLVNIQWIHLVASNQEIAKEWTNELFKQCNDVNKRWPSRLTQLEQIWVKLIGSFTSSGEIPVKYIMKFFAGNKEDKKRVEKSLSDCGLCQNKVLSTLQNDSVKSKEFTFTMFLEFFDNLMQYNEANILLKNILYEKKPYPHLTLNNFLHFLNDTQRDKRLNEILHPFTEPTKARELIARFEPCKELIMQERLSPEGLLRYLMSDESSLIRDDFLNLSQDMSQPLAHYFVNSSHNTYLSGHQLTGRSSSEIYRQVLLSGCRCIELDCWDGKGAEEEPVVTHGFTMCSEVPFKEVIEAISESSFKASNYPVILSFENHCTTKQQKKMVQVIKDKLGDRIQCDPLPDHPLEPGTPLPSPTMLMGKFLIKNKKVGINKTTESEIEIPCRAFVPEEEDCIPETQTEHMRDIDNEIYTKRIDAKEEVLALEISAMVTYMEPFSFSSFQDSEKANVSYKCCSFSETHATNLLKEQPIDFVKFNTRQLSRIYPKGTRVDSSNYMPQLYWNAGCQLVALNFQSLDLALQLNLGIFAYQRECGLLLKPFLLRAGGERVLDPFVEGNVDGVVASTLSIRILTGQLLVTSRGRVGTYVELDMFGLPADTVRKRFRTRVVPANGLNPVYTDEAFVFQKVIYPQLAVLRIAVFDETGRILGQQILPVDAITPGYRHVQLRNEISRPLLMSSLFVYIEVKDYVPHGLAEFAAALANPIAFVSALERHTQQLAVLTDDFEGNEKMPCDEAVDSRVTFASSTHLESGASSVYRSKSSSEDHLPDATSTPFNAKRKISKKVFGRGVSFLNNAPLSEDPARFLTKTILNELTLEDLKKNKKVERITNKAEKELETFRKKYEKNLQSIDNHYNSKLKRESTVLKKTTSKIERRFQKSLRQARRSADDDLEQINNEEKRTSENLKEEYQSKLSKLQHSRSEEGEQLSRDLYELEYAIKVGYLEPYIEEMGKTLTTEVANCQQVLSDIYARESAVLSGLQEARRREEMRDLSLQARNKEELSRMKGEVQQTHIQRSVAERHKLKMLLDLRSEEINQMAEKLNVDLQIMKYSMLTDYDDELKEKTSSS